MAATEWRPAPDLEELARPIIAAYHAHLIGYPLRFLWRSNMRSVRGSKAMATAEIVSGRWAAILMTDEEKDMEGQDGGYKFFLVEVAEEAWETLSEKQRLALLDHEICHCGVDEDPETGEVKMKMIPHDLEEFNAVVERHGLWLGDVQRFAETILMLPAP